MQRGRHDAIRSLPVTHQGCVKKRAEWGDGGGMGRGCRGDSAVVS